MHDLWPPGNKALEMSVADLALWLLRTIDSGRLQERGLTARRNSVIGMAVAQHHIDRQRAAGDRGVLQIEGEDAMRRNPALARKYAAAWDFLLREGSLAQDPIEGSAVYVTDQGRERIRGQTTKPGTSKVAASRRADEATSRQASENSTRSTGDSTPQASARTHQSHSIGLRLRTVFGFAGAVGVFIQILTAPTVIIGLTTGAAIVIALLPRSLWRWPPPALPTLAVIAGAACGGLIAANLPGTSSANRRGPVSSPSPSPTRFVPHLVGALGGGNNLVAVTPAGVFVDPVTVAVGHEQRVAFRLDNAGPDDLKRVVVKLTVPDVATPVLALEGQASSPTANPSLVTDILTIRIRGGDPACLSVVPGSVILDAKAGGSLRRLPDQLLGAGIDVGPIPVNQDNSPRYVELSLQVRAAGLRAAC